MGLRNLPTDAASALADMISCRPGQVSSMALTDHASGCAITLLAFSAGESVSEEAYESDVLYFCVEGELSIVSDEAVALVSAGEALAVPAGLHHAVEGPGGFKVLQVAVG